MDEELNPEMSWEAITCNFITYYLRYISVSPPKGSQQSLYDLQGEVASQRPRFVEQQGLYPYEDK
jgi:hypothetical protein